jgi:hypothetical protein
MHSLEIKPRENDELDDKKQEDRHDCAARENDAPYMGLETHNVNEILRNRDIRLVHEVTRIMETSDVG